MLILWNTIILPSPGETLQKNELFYYGVYYGLLRILQTFITEIMVLLQGNLFTLKRLSQIEPENPTIRENRKKIGTFLLRILQNITDITNFLLLRNITEKYGP